MCAGKEKIIHDFWKAVASQDETKLLGFFEPNAEIYWHCTNEKFNAAGYVKANCVYPGKWCAEVQKTSYTEEGAVSVTRVFNEAISLHAVSFFVFFDDRIMKLEEYWADDGLCPEWREKLDLSEPIIK